MFYDQFILLCRKYNEKPTPLLQKLKLSPGNLKRWKEGASVNSDILLLMAEYFHVSVDYLLTGKENLGESSSFSAISLTDDELRLLQNYRILTDIEKGELLGRAAYMAEHSIQKAGAG